MTVLDGSIPDPHTLSPARPVMAAPVTLARLGPGQDCPADRATDRVTEQAADLLADVVAGLAADARRGGIAYGRTRLGAPWGIRFPPRSIASIHVATGGTYHLTPDGGAPIRVAEGDVVLLPSGGGHIVGDLPGRPASRVQELSGATLRQMSPAELVADGGGPRTTLLCGAYLLPPAPRHPLTATLPDVVHVPAEEVRRAGLSAAVAVLAGEVERARPGASAVVASALDLLFASVLRFWVDAGAEESTGLIRALGDPTVGAALALMHQDPGRRWTVESLAHAVAAPRARFSRRFTALTGQPPMAYLTAWRMTVAARLLRAERAPLRQVAGRVGYDSEFAFARAFKRAVGQAPGRYRAEDRRIR